MIAIIDYGVGNLFSLSSSLRFLGLEVPEDGLPGRHSTDQDDAVTNYHLQKLLEARTYLLRLLQER